MKDFLLTNLKRNCEEFEHLVEGVDIEQDLELKERILSISKKCHEISNMSLNILSQEVEEEVLEEIENCAMGLSEIRSWIKACAKNKDLDSEIEDIFNFFGDLGDMMDRMEFIDSLESKSTDLQKTLRVVMKKKIKENRKIWANEHNLNKL
ncbi:MAG: hypothetical protein ABFD15_03840 [Methanofastidiosum sp.]